MFRSKHLNIVIHLLCTFDDRQCDAINLIAVKVTQMCYHSSNVGTMIICSQFQNDPLNHHGLVLFNIGSIWGFLYLRFSKATWPLTFILMTSGSCIVLDMIWSHPSLLWHCWNWYILIHLHWFIHIDWYVRFYPNSMLWR